MSSESPPFTIESLAKRYNVTPKTVKRWLHQGTAPPHFRQGRQYFFDRESVIQYERERER